MENLEAVCSSDFTTDVRFVVLSREKKRYVVIYHSGEIEYRKRRFLFPRTVYSWNVNHVAKELPAVWPQILNFFNE